LRALVAGEVHIAVTDMLAPREYIKTGDLRPIAVTGPERVPTYPDVLTMDESGISGFKGYGWLGLFAPAGTPENVIVEIANAFNEVQKDPKLAAWFKDMAVLPSSTTPEEFRDIYERDREVWT